MMDFITHGFQHCVLGVGWDSGLMDSVRTDESKTHLFLIHFSGMLLTIFDLILCQIMEYSRTLCFACVI